MEKEISNNVSQRINVYRKRIKLKFNYSVDLLLPNSQKKQSIKHITDQYEGIGQLRLDNCTDDHQINKIIERECQNLTKAYQTDQASQDKILQIDSEIQLIIFYSRISKYNHLIEKLIIQAALWPELYSLTWDQLNKLVDNTKYKAQLKKYSKFKHTSNQAISTSQLKIIYKQLKEPLNPDKLQMYLNSRNHSYPTINSSIVVIGRTGAGKTTWLQTVMGYHHKLVKDSQTRLYMLQTKQPLKQKHKELIAKKGVVSVTSDIHIIKFGETAQEMQILNEVGINQEITLVDCPGLNDTRGKQVEIANNYLRNNFLRSCTKIIVVQIVNISIFMTDRINNVRNYADYLTKQYKFTDDVQLASHLILLYNNCNLKGIKWNSNRHFIDQMESENEVRQLYLILSEQIMKQFECDAKLISAYKFMQKQLEHKVNLIEKVEAQSYKRKQLIMLHLITKRVYTETDSFINNFLNIELEDELDDTIAIQRQKLMLYLQRKQFLEMHYQFRTLELLFTLNSKAKIIQAWKGKIKQQIQKYMQQIKRQLARGGMQCYLQNDMPSRIISCHHVYRDIGQILNDFDVDTQKYASLQQQFRLFTQNLVSFVCNNHSQLVVDQIKQEYLAVRQYMKEFSKIEAEDIAACLGRQIKQMAQQYEQVVFDYNLLADDRDLTNMQQIQLTLKSLCLKNYKYDLYRTSNSNSAFKFELLQNAFCRKIRQIYKNLIRELRYNIKIYSYKRKQFFVVYQLQNAVHKSPQPLQILISLQKVDKLNELQLSKQIIQRQQISMPNQVHLLFKTLQQSIVDCCKYVSTQEIYANDQTLSHFRQAILAFKKDVSRVICSEFTIRYFPQLIYQHQKLQEMIRYKRAALVETLQQIQNIISNQKLNIRVMRQCRQKMKYFKHLQLYSKYLQFQQQINLETTLTEKFNNYFVVQNQLKQQFKSTTIFDAKLFCSIVSPAQHLVALKSVLKYVLPADSSIFHQIDRERQSIVNFINLFTESLTKGIGNLKIKLKLLCNEKDKQQDNYLLFFINLQQFINFNFDDYEIAQLSSQQVEISKLLRDLFQQIEDKIHEIELKDILQPNIPTLRYSEQAKVQFIEKMYSLAMKLLKQLTRKDIIPCEQLLFIIQNKMKDFFSKNVQQFKSMDNLSAFNKQSLLSNVQIYSSLVYLIKSRQQSQKSQAQVYHEYTTLRLSIQNLFQKLSLNKFADQTRTMFHKFSINNSRFQMKQFNARARQAKSDPQKLSIFTEYFQQYLGNLLAKLSKVTQQFTFDFLSQLEDILPKIKQFFSIQNILLSTFETQLKKSFTRHKDFLVEECNKYLSRYNIRDAIQKLSMLKSWAQVINNFSEDTINQQIYQLQIKILTTEKKCLSIKQRVNSDDEVLQQDILNQDEQSLQYCLSQIYSNVQFKSKLQNRLRQILLRTIKRIQSSTDILLMSQIYQLKYQKVKYIIHYLFYETKSYKIIFQPLFNDIIWKILKEAEKNVQDFDFSPLSCDQFEKLQVWAKVKCSIRFCQDLKKDYATSYDILNRVKQRSRKYLSELVQQLCEAQNSSLKVQLLVKTMKIREVIKILINQQTKEIYSAIKQHFNNLTCKIAQRITDYFQQQTQNTQLIEQLHSWLIDTKPATDTQAQGILEDIRSRIGVECFQILQKHAQKYGGIFSLQNYLKLNEQKQDGFAQLQKDIIFCTKYQRIQSFTSHFRPNLNRHQSKITHFFYQLTQIFESNSKLQIEDQQIFFHREIFSNSKLQIEDQQIFFHREIFSNEQNIILDTNKIQAKICFLRKCLQLQSVQCPIDLKKYVQFPKILSNNLIQSAQILIRQFSSSIPVNHELNQGFLVNKIINFNPKVYYLFTLFHRVSTQKYADLIQHSQESSQVKLELVDQVSVSSSEVLILQQTEHLIECAMQYFVGQEDKFKQTIQKLIKSKINQIIIPARQVEVQPIQIISNMIKDYLDLVQYKIEIAKTSFTRLIKRKYRNPFARILFYICKSLNLTLNYNQLTNIFTLINKIQNQLDLDNPKDYRKLLHVEIEYRFIVRLMIALYLLKNGNDVYFEVRDQKKCALLQKKLSKVRLDIKQQLRNNLYFGSLDKNNINKYLDVDAEHQLFFSENQSFYTQYVLLFDFQSVFELTAKSNHQRIHDLQIINKRFKNAKSFKTIFMFKACCQTEILNKRIQNLSQNIINLQIEISKPQGQILRYQSNSSSFSQLINEVQRICKDSASALIICFESKENLHQFIQKEKFRLSKLINYIVIADTDSQIERIDIFKWQVLGKYTRCLLTTREIMLNLEPIKLTKSTSSQFLQLILCYQPCCRGESNLMKSIVKYFSDDYSIKYFSTP